MIQTLSGQSSSILTGLLSGFTAPDRKPADGFPLSKPKNAAAGKADADAAVSPKLSNSAPTDAPEGVPPAVASAFPDFAELALNIVDRASLGSAASAARADTESRLLTEITSILGPSQGDGSLSGAMDTASQAFADWSKSSDDPAKRSAAFSALGAVIKQVSSARSGLEDLANSIDGQIRDEANAVSDALKRLKTANADLLIAKSDGSDTSTAETTRRQAVAQLAEHVEMRFQDRPDGTLVPLQADGTPMPDTLDEMSPQSIQSGVTGGRLGAMIDLRDGVIPDIQRRLRALAANLGDRLNAAASLAPASSVTGTDSGLGPNDRLGLSGTVAFTLVDQEGRAQASVAIDFSGRTRRTLSTPPMGLNVQTPAQLAKAVTDGLSGHAALTFANGTFTFASNNDRYRVQIASGDSGPATRGGRSFASTFGLGRIVDSPTPEGGPSGLSANEPTGFAADQGFTISLIAPSGKTASARITADGKSFGDLLNAINDPEKGLGRAMNLTLDKDGSLAKAVAPAFVGGRLAISDDTTVRSGTGQSFSTLFGFDAGKPLAIAPGVDASTIQSARAVFSDKQRGQPVAAAQDGSAAAKLSQAFSAEMVVPAGPDRPTRILSFPQAAAELSADAGAQASAANAVNLDATTFALALKDERGRLSSASFGAELSHLSSLQTARNIDGRLDAQATGLIAHIDRALASQQQPESLAA